MIALYHWEPNGVFLKPLMALAEKGAAYTSHWFDPTAFEQYGTGFPANTESALQLEREGPLLVVAGEVLSSTSLSPYTEGQRPSMSFWVTRLPAVTCR